MVEEWIRFLIAQMEQNSQVKLSLKCHHNDLITDLKNKDYQSPMVVYYVTLVLDITLIVMTSHGPEIYWPTEQYDRCSPHLIVYRDDHQRYHPVHYLGSGGSDSDHLGSDHLTPITWDWAALVVVNYSPIMTIQ